MSFEEFEVDPGRRLLLRNGEKVPLKAKAIIFNDHTQGLWRQDLSSDRPHEFEAPDDLRIYYFAYSRDGSMAYSGGNQVREIILLERASLPE